MQKQTQIFIGIGLLVVLILCWSKIKAFAQSKGIGTTAKPDTTTSGSSTGGSVSSGSSTGGSTTQQSLGCAGGIVNINDVLRRGSCNAATAKLQRILNFTHAAGLVVDGNFGAKTEAALTAAVNKSSVTLAQVYSYYPAAINV